MRLGFRHDHRKFAISVALLSVFVVLQVHRARPLVPPRLFRSRTLVAANVGMLLAGAGMFATFFFLTLYMQEVLRFSPLRAGVGYLPISAMIISSAALASKTLGRVGPASFSPRASSWRPPVWCTPTTAERAESPPAPIPMRPPVAPFGRHQPYRIRGLGGRTQPDLVRPTLGGPHSGASAAGERIPPSMSSFE